jgi:hydroxymethylpyrimidine pyrophosphatase-like HAD family hydrolase
VDAVLGENGAFVLEKSEGRLTIRSDVGLDELKQQQQLLKAQVLAILEAYPGVELTLDQSYRLCEVAIDIGQNRAKLAPELVEKIISQIQELGAHATASSIHINAWYGEHSKKKSSWQYLKNQGLSDEEIDHSCCYVGDSLNDQYMFEALSKSVGVANISHYWDKLVSKPKVVTQQSGGYGFAEFAEQLLELRQT